MNVQYRASLKSAHAEIEIYSLVNGDSNNA